MTEAEAQGLVGLGGKLIGSLPAQFLMLCCINIMFVGGLLWFLDRRDSARERLITPIVASCLQDLLPTSARRPD